MFSCQIISRKKGWRVRQRANIKQYGWLWQWLSLCPVSISHRHSLPVECARKMCLWHLHGLSVTFLWLPNNSSLHRYFCSQVWCSGPGMSVVKGVCGAQLWGMQRDFQPGWLLRSVTWSGSSFGLLFSGNKLVLQKVEKYWIYEQIHSFLRMRKYIGGHCPTRQD